MELLGIHGLKIVICMHDSKTVMACRFNKLPHIDFRDCQKFDTFFKSSTLLYFILRFLRETGLIVK